MKEQNTDYVVVGHVAGAHGIRGWVKLRSDTEPMDNILNYHPWYLRRGETWQAFAVAEGRVQGKALVVRFEGISDRDAALTLRGAEIAVKRAQLPPPEPGEYYWIDLIGLRVITLQGQELGRIDSLMQTGANDVLVVKGERERLIPFVRDIYVMSVSLEEGMITVDWDPED